MDDDLATPILADADANAKAAYDFAIALGRRWPDGEAFIAQDPECAFYYAAEVINDRFLEAEATIANSECKNAYLGIFPSAKDDWAMNGWLDWLDT